MLRAHRLDLEPACSVTVILRTLLIQAVHVQAMQAYANIMREKKDDISVSA
jgi:hypothetical protein